MFITHPLGTQFYRSFLYSKIQVSVQVFQNNQIGFTIQFPGKILIECEVGSLVTMILTPAVLNDLVTCDCYGMVCYLMFMYWTMESS